MSVKQRIVKVISAIALAVALVLGIAPASASAANNVNTMCQSLTSRTIYNIPKAIGGKTAQQKAVTDMVRCVVRRALPGSSIDIGMYSWTLEDAAKDLVNAHKRKVHITYATSSRKNFKEIQALRRELNSTHNKWELDSRSYLAFCEDSCMDSGPDGNQHSKLITVSAFKGKHGKIIRNTVFNLSNNPTIDGTSVAYGTANITVNNKRLYDGAARYLRLQRYDKNHYNVGPVCSNTSKNCSTGILLYLYPRSKHDKYRDPVGDAIKHSSCKAKKGYGYKGHTVWRFAPFHWTNSRQQVAKDLVALKKKGCYVYVIYNHSHITKTILSILKKGHVPVRDAERSSGFRYNAKSKECNAKTTTMYAHAKTYLVSGTVDKKSVTWTWNGTLNMTGSALQPSTENEERIPSRAEYNRQVKQFGVMWSHAAPVYRAVDDSNKKCPLVTVK